MENDTRTPIEKIAHGRFSRDWKQAELLAREQDRVPAREAADQSDCDHWSVTDLGPGHGGLATRCDICGYVHIDHNYVMAGERYDNDPPKINRQTEEGFALFKERNPTARQCNKDTQFDPSIEGAKWVHMEAVEVFDDGENHLEYECIHCGEHYHIYLPD